MEKTDIGTLKNAIRKLQDTRNAQCFSLNTVYLTLLNGGLDVTCHLVSTCPTTGNFVELYQ